MRAHDALGRLDAFHLRHRDVHQHHVRLQTVVLRDGGEAIAGFSGDLSAELLDHLGDVLAREDGIVHHKEPHRLPVLAAQQR